MADCPYITTGEQDEAGRFGFRCPECDRLRWSKYDDPALLHDPCGVFNPPQSDLPIGDAVASVLDRVGITKERYQQALQAVGFTGLCRCKERQAKLNELGDKLAKWWRGGESK
jgi:hypothetical protein